jgi:FAD/FMN-containing dehydrogenases
VPQASAVAFLGAENLTAVLGVFEAARRQSNLTIQAFEYLDSDCLDVVLRHGGGARPVDSECPSYVLVEVEAETEDKAQADLASWLEACFEEELILDGVVAQSSKDAVALWHLREGISESLTREAFLYKYDVAVPVVKMAEFEKSLGELAREKCKGYPVYLFGHVGDGNLHLNVLKPEDVSKEDFLETCRNAEPAIFDLIRSYQGSVSAEHGIGLLKKKALPYSRTATELDLFRGMKKIFDPKGLMNPGKILD